MPAVTGYLPDSGVIRYNGYTLYGPRNSVQLEVTPQRDSSGRYVTHSVYRFSIDAWLTADSAYGHAGDGTNAGTHVTSLEGALEQDGGELEISGFGFGTFAVNGTTSNRDVAWGPKVQFLKMRNVGAGCVVLVWVIDVAIKRCLSGSISGILGRIKEYTYNVSWSIKPNGCTVRTVSGHLEIYHGRELGTGTTFSRTADDYRDFVTVEQPQFFVRRQPQEYTLSENKQRLSFKVVDEEQESDNAFPTGVSDIDMRHTVHNSTIKSAGIGGGGPTVFYCSFSGYVEVAKTFEVQHGFTRVLLLIQQRIGHAEANKGHCILSEITITENLFKRVVEFEVKYVIIQQEEIPRRTPGIDQMVYVSGLFLETKNAAGGTNWENYRDSMQLAWSNRGTAKLRHDPSSDKMLDGCSESSNVTIKDNASSFSFIPSSATASMLICPETYTYWENYVDVLGVTSLINVQQMPEAESTQPEQVVDLLGHKTTLGRGFLPGKKQKVLALGDGSPKVTITVNGMATRIGKPPEIPELVKVFGSNASADKSRSRTKLSIVSYVNGNCPVHSAYWSHVYDVSFASQDEMTSALGALDGLYGLVFKTESDSNVK